jgi:hypothetical protein
MRIIVALTDAAEPGSFPICPACGTPIVQTIVTIETAPPLQIHPECAENLSDVLWTVGHRARLADHLMVHSNTEE